MRKLLLFLLAATMLAQPTPKENLQRAIGENTITGTNKGAPLQVQTIAALKAVTVANVTNGQVVQVVCYSTIGDGGGGEFYYSSASAATANDGTIIAPTSGSGRWLRAWTGDVNVKWFNAKGDGVTDDTTGIQAAIDTGYSVFFPASSGYYLLTSAIAPVSNQRLYGVGAASIVRQTTANASVITISGKTNVTVEHLTVYAVGSVSTELNGMGVNIEAASSKCAVRFCYVKNHRGSGVGVTDSNECIVESNVFTDSPVQNSDNHTQASADVTFQYASSRNIARNNICISGQGVGIEIQTVDSGDVADNNIIIGNVVRNAKQYGIMAYRLNNGDSVQNCLIESNTVENISGAIAHSVSGYIYGTGIYIQGAEGAIVTGNSVKNTHTAAVVFVTLLAPAGITTTNVTRVTLTSNRVDTDSLNGIWLDDTNALGASTGYAIVANNDVRNIAGPGVRVTYRTNVKLDGNTIDTCAGRGIHVLNQTSQKAGITVTGNEVANITGASGYGVDAEYCYGIQISGNRIRNVSQSGIALTTCDYSGVSSNLITVTGLHGITLSACDDSAVTGNNIYDHTTRGIQVVSTSDRALVSANNVRGDGSSSEGIRLDAKTRGGNNQSTNSVANWIGDYAQYQSAAPASGTWEVGDTVLNDFLSTNTYIGWVNVSAGSPGTFRQYGAVIP